MIENDGSTGIDMKRKKQLWWQIPFLVLLIVGTIFIVRQQQSLPYQNDKGFVFGTMYSITYQSEENLNDEIVAELKRVDDEFSMFNEKSTVTQFNRGNNPKLSQRFLEVYKLARFVHDDTEGAFDITVAPLVNAWGFGFKHEVIPSDAQVDSLRSFVGMEQLTFDDANSVLKKNDQRMMLDFSAVAKGYGCDCVAELLRNRGVKNFMVEIGGEVVTQGISPTRVPWRIGVTKPVEDTIQTSQDLQTILNVTDKAMATSGNYRNFYYSDGRKFTHTIDPRTGYPVQHSLLSATVLADDCATADAYATSFMVMGLEPAKALLERHQELKAYLIYSGAQGRYAVWCSPSLKESIND